jgi:hypothetical protein
MRDLHITVRDKVANYNNRDGKIVCGNSDYQIVFNFDEEWRTATNIKARFIWNGQYRDVSVVSNKATVPVITNTKKLVVGVYADNISTTAVVIPCALSVLCEGGVNG